MDIVIHTTTTTTTTTTTIIIVIAITTITIAMHVITIIIIISIVMMIIIIIVIIIIIIIIIIVIIITLVFPAGDGLERQGWLGRRQLGRRRRSAGRRTSDFRQNEKGGFTKGGKNKTQISIFILNRWTLEFHPPLFQSPPFHSGKISGPPAPEPGSIRRAHSKAGLLLFCYRVTLLELFPQTGLGAFYIFSRWTFSRPPYMFFGRQLCQKYSFPDHRHRNLKAFEEHTQSHVSCCFVTG